METYVPVLWHDQLYVLQMESFETPCLNTFIWKPSSRLLRLSNLLAYHWQATLKIVDIITFEQVLGIGMELCIQSARFLSCPSSLWFLLLVLKGSLWPEVRRFLSLANTKPPALRLKCDHRKQRHIAQPVAKYLLLD
jgi:hypothetical protein